MAGNFKVDHVALRVRDATATAKFYCDYAGMEIIHERESDGLWVKWVQPKSQRDFMLVLIEQPDFCASGTASMDHFGVHVNTRAEVDAIAARAKQDGCLVVDACYGGPVIGYLCEIRDPDGNVLEFACEQYTVDQTNE